MNDVKIDTNVPVPMAKTKYGFELMDIGDSIFFDQSTHDSNCVAAAKIYAKRNKLKFTIRKMDNGIRVWRIS